MSRWSGKADLADHISGLGGWYDKDGNKVKFGQDGVYAYYSDTLKDFEAFKKRTGGVIYQHVHIKEITEWNHDFIKKHCDNFEIIEHSEQIPDKRNKTGFRTNKYFTYKYWDKEYTAKELSKKGIYMTKEIHFNTLLDLIPYFPYLVSMSCSSDGKETVYITNESYVDEQENSFIQHGIESDSAERYRKELANFYLEVCRDYFLKDLDKRTHNFPIVSLSERDDGYYLRLDCKFNSDNYKIDYMHDLEYVWADGKTHEHWTSPKFVDENTIKLSKEDVNYFLKDDIANGRVTVKYVSKMEFPVNLN